MKRTLVAAAALAASAAAGAESLSRHVVERVASACVLIQAAEGRQGSMGSGFFVTRSEVLTNHHVVKAAIEGDAQLAIVVKGGPQGYKVAQATVVASDEELDLALLRTDERASHILRFLSDRSLKVTQPIWVAGFPFGTKPGLEVSVTAGTISSLRHDEAGKLREVQLDAAVNPGNSGGPVVDSMGRVVGVSRATVSPTVGSGMALAIPSGVAESFVEVGQRVRRRSAGLRLVGKSSRPGLHILRAEKVEEPWGTAVQLTVRGARGAEDAAPFLVEVVDRRRQILKRDAVLIDDLQDRQEKTYTIRLRGAEFNDVTSCNILD